MGNVIVGGRRVVVGKWREIYYWESEGKDIGGKEKGSAVVGKWGKCFSGKVKGFVVGNWRKNNGGKSVLVGKGREV